jgi:hypothetical protein
MMYFFAQIAFRTVLDAPVLAAPRTAAAAAEKKMNLNTPAANTGIARSSADTATTVTPLQTWSVKEM